MTIDQKGGKWYKYWSDTARETMAEHVDQILQMYGEGCTTCRLGQKQVLPTCTMWDPIAAPSFDQDGIERYQKFLKEKYKNNISLFNERYDLDIDDFKFINELLGYEEVKTRGLLVFCDLWRGKLLYRRGYQKKNKEVLDMER